MSRADKIVEEILEKHGLHQENLEAKWILDSERLHTAIKAAVTEAYNRDAIHGHAKPLATIQRITPAHCSHSRNNGAMCFDCLEVF